MDYLKPGDIIDIVAPSSKCHISVLEKMNALLTSWQLKCSAPADLFGDSILYANSDEKRFLHLKNALVNPDSKAVWCLLGGYGATKLIPMLNQIPAPSKPKIVIGFSAVSYTHLTLPTIYSV